jgi:hemerythrin-like domain-containing protein
MCEYCGCKTVPLIRELMDEHTALLDQAVHIRRALAEQRWERAGELLQVFTHLLERHVTREERGVFAAMRAAGEFVEEVAALEDEHVVLDTAVNRLEPGTIAGLETRFAELVVRLGEHIEREDLGIFPVAVVSLGGPGWDLVEQAHELLPSFLAVRAGDA